MKKIIIISLFLIPCIVKSMEEDISNKIGDIHIGNPPDWQPLDPILVLDANDPYDLGRAYRAAFLIFCNNSVKARDQHGKTPLDYAEKTKDKLPTCIRLCKQVKLKKNLKKNVNLVKILMIIRRSFVKGKVIHTLMHTVRQRIQFFTILV